MTLPFDPPLNRLWLDIIKIIDVFHFKNHTSEECKKKYSPQQIKEANPDFNTQAGEQTFIWVGRFKNILCSMNKTHHLFYLHRMVLRRNTYTAKCYKHGRKPVLPKKWSILLYCWHALSNFFILSIVASLFQYWTLAAWSIVGKGGNLELTSYRGSYWEERATPTSGCGIVSLHLDIMGGDISVIVPPKTFWKALGETYETTIEMLLK